MKSISLYRYEHPETAFKLCGVPQKIIQCIDHDFCFIVGGVSVQEEEDVPRYLNFAEAHDLESLLDLAKLRLPVFPSLYGLLGKIKDKPGAYRLFVLYAENGLYGDKCIYTTDICDLDVILLSEKLHPEEEKLLTEIRLEYMTCFWRKCAIKIMKWWRSRKGDA